MMKIRAGDWRLLFLLVPALVCSFLYVLSFPLAQICFWNVVSNPESLETRHCFLFRACSLSTSLFPSYLALLDFSSGAISSYHFTSFSPLSLQHASRPRYSGSFPSYAFLLTLPLCSCTFYLCLSLYFILTGLWCRGHVY